DCGGSTLTVPKNLYIIATMNSSDRSIGHIDVAIRRRFGLYPLGPSSSVVQKEWETAGYKDYGVQLAKLMERLNKMLRPENDPSAEAELGVGHSYFLPIPGVSGEAAKQQVQMKWHCARKAWERGKRCKKQLETFRRNPAGNQARPVEWPTAGSESCVLVQQWTGRSVDSECQGRVIEPRNLRGGSPRFCHCGGRADFVVWPVESVLPGSESRA